MPDRKISERQLNILGLFLIGLAFLPCILLGEGSVVQVGDQLDGEIFTYLYGAKYLFSRQERIAEYMGGIRREALFPPAPVLIFLYRIFSPFAAFLTGQILTSAAAFLGMCALLRYLDCDKYTSFCTGMLFALLPFYSVYGLSVSGLPMLLWAFLRLKEDGEKHGACSGSGAGAGIGYAIKKWEPERLFPLLLVCCYGALSSFVLIGYAVIGCLFLFCLWLGLGKQRRLYGGVYAASLGLLLFYLAVNRDLVGQVFGIGQTQISHKSEYILQPQPLWHGVWEMFVHGSGHAPSYHGWMILPVMVFLFVGLLRCRKLTWSQKKQYKWIAACFMSALFIALFYGAFHSAFVVGLRQRMGSFFVYFQLDRIYWFYPLLWYLMLGLSLSILFAPCISGQHKLQDGKNIQTLQSVKSQQDMKHAQHMQNVQNGSRRRNRQDRQKKLRFAATAFILCVASAAVLWRSDFKKNVRQLISPATSHAVTWEKYYGTEVFEQIDAFIGRDKSWYRVACVGLNPAAAAYNGFYTVDGYSNNYELSYKQAFRKVIAGELEKDEMLAGYFDDWGNRCYLFSAELGQEYYFEKDNGVRIQELSVNTGALQALGCEYVFAGVPVENAEALGWALLGSFEAHSTDCRYRIFVYGLGKNTDTVAVN